MIYDGEDSSVCLLMLSWILHYSISYNKQPPPLKKRVISATIYPLNISITKIR